VALYKAVFANNWPPYIEVLKSSHKVRIRLHTSITSCHYFSPSNSHELIAHLYAAPPFFISDIQTGAPGVWAPTATTTMLVHCLLYVYIITIYGDTKGHSHLDKLHIKTTTCRHDWIWIEWGRAHRLTLNKHLTIPSTSNSIFILTASVISWATLRAACRVTPSIGMSLMATTLSPAFNWPNLAQHKHKERSVGKQSKHWCKNTVLALYVVLFIGQLCERLYCTVVWY